MGPQLPSPCKAGRVRKISVQHTAVLLPRTPTRTNTGKSVGSPKSISDHYAHIIRAYLRSDLHSCLHSNLYTHLHSYLYISACLGTVPSRPGKRDCPQLGVVYCVVGYVLLSVVKFVGSCSVVRGFVGWRVAVYTHCYFTSPSTHVDAAASTYNVAVALYISRPVCSLS